MSQVAGIAMFGKDGVRTVEGDMFMSPNEYQNVKDSMVESYVQCGKHMIDYSKKLAELNVDLLRWPLLQFWPQRTD